MKREDPQSAGKVRQQWGSDAISELLGQLDLEFVALTPGASFRGLHDSIVNYLANTNPKILLTLHEEHAVAIAHGYAKVTEKPMGVIIHSNVGLMHATMSIFNAWCDRVPVIIIGATGPMDAARRRPWIDWIHTATDQASLVRDYTKWDDQPASVPAALESLIRASHLCRTAPCGPVYICLDAALQETKLDEQITMPDVSRFKPPPSQHPSEQMVREAANLLCRAQNPLILMGRTSRSREAWDRRVKLAESLGVKVLTDMKVSASFPTKHPLHVAAPNAFLAQDTVELIREADVILSLDFVDLDGTLKTVWGKRPVSAKIISCSVDCYNHRGWSMDCQGLPPVDVYILAEPDVFVPHLLTAIEELGRSNDVGKNATHYESTQIQNDASRAKMKSGPITTRDLAHCLHRAIDKRETSYLRLPIRWPSDVSDFRDPLDYLGRDGGAGVGSGPGIAVGAALALRGSGRLPVAILGDGDYLMGVTALWTAAHYHIPLLIIVANNRSFYNSEEHQGRIAKQRGRPVENRWIGTRIDDPPADLAAMGRAQGMQGEGPIIDLDELPSALSRAISAVEDGKGYIVDVVVKPA
jgi:thiamine pyrophosphate-dependent acetolactate synthase large subunit-like protein